MFRNTYTERTEFVFCAAMDANYRVFFGGVGYPGMLPNGDEENLLRDFEQRRSGFPTPSGPSGMRRPFTFLGTENFRGNPWMRVASAAKNEVERREIKLGLRPAQIAYEILLARFGLLRTTIPTPNSYYIKRMTRCIAVLHNYFLSNNSAYAAEYKDLDQMMTNLSLDTSAEFPAPSISVPRRSLGEDKEWLGKMYMDENAYRCLINLAMPIMQSIPSLVDPEVCLKVALRYMATMQGYDEQLCNILDTAFKVFDFVLNDYEGVVSTEEGMGFSNAA